jgi:uncharacterized protein YceK
LKNVEPGNYRFIWKNFFLLPIALCGCAAITTRETDGAGRPYIGVRTDAYAVAHPADAPRPLWVPFMALDIPLSFVVDTICLPYDLVEARRAKTFEPRQNSIPQN